MLAQGPLYPISDIGFAICTLLVCATFLSPLWLLALLLLFSSIFMQFSTGFFSTKMLIISYYPCTHLLPYLQNFVCTTMYEVAVPRAWIPAVASSYRIWMYNVCFIKTDTHLLLCTQMCIRFNETDIRKKIQLIKLDISNWRIAKIKCR